MTSLKRWNSAVESNADSGITLPKRACACRARVSSCSARARLSSGFRLSGKFVVSQPASHDLFHHGREPFGIRKVSGVEAKHLLVNVSLKVGRVHAHVGSLKRALQETPEVLHSVYVNLPLYVAFQFVDHLMRELYRQGLVGVVLVGVDGRSRFHVCQHVLVDLVML